MNIQEFIPIALLIFLGSICFYTLLDRVCKCIEYCALTKSCTSGLEGLVNEQGGDETSLEVEE